MSVLTLESLPNEILINILQKYIHGTDILLHFLGQLNTRFDALIAQCQRFSFNFKEIRKDDFLKCVSLLPQYADKIRVLTLSEWYTPGEINIFLSTFTSFDQFKYLRVLNVHFDGNNIDFNRVMMTIRSLSNTNIHRLSIVLENVWHSRGVHESQSIIGAIFKISTMKSLSFDSGFLTFDPYVYRSFHTNLEYLNLENTSIYWVDLRMILSCARHLTYLNVKLTNNASSPRRIFGVSIRLYHCLIKLRSFIIHFNDPFGAGFRLLINCFPAMPNLTNLKVSSESICTDAEAWEQVLTKFFPLLTDFLLLISRIDLKVDQISNILTSFQNPFWISKKNFNLILTTAMNEYQFQKLFNKSFVALQDPFEKKYRKVIDLSTVQLWSAPNRSATDNVYNIINIEKLSLSTNSVSSVYQHYFNNVTTLHITCLNTCLIEWMMTYINLSRIKHVNIWNSDHSFDTIVLLLSCTTDISTLQISSILLLSNQTEINFRCDRLKSLDISSDKHTFTEDDIKTITHRFPNLEHLKINTIDLYNVPLLNVYLPYLRSLTFKIIDDLCAQSNNNIQQQWENVIQQNTQFFFTRTSDWVTIWIDHYIFNETYWQIFRCQQELQHNDLSNDSTIPQTKHNSSLSES